MKTILESFGHEFILDPTTCYFGSIPVSALFCFKCEHLFYCDENEIVTRKDKQESPIWVYYQKDNDIFNKDCLTCNELIIEDIIE